MSVVDFDVISDKSSLSVKVVAMLMLFSGVSVLIYLESEHHFSIIDWLAAIVVHDETAFNTTRVYILNHPTNGPIVNPHSFKYLINQQHACIEESNRISNGTSEAFDDLFSIIYVHSAPENFDRRVLIRKTWGNCSATKYKCRILFFLGLSQKVGVQKAIEIEADVYKDIIQEDFIDHYHNLTYKALGAMKWISEFCRKSRFILKSDDDMFVNTIKLFKLLDLKYRGPMRRKIFCYVWTRSPVLRSGKWKVSQENLPQSFYPQYCSGSAFILSGDLAPHFFNVSHYVPYVWVDDAYLTGFLPLKLGNVTFEYLNGFYSFRSTASSEIMFVHTDRPENVKELWKKAVTSDMKQKLHT